MVGVGEYVRTKHDGIYKIFHINHAFEDNEYNKVCMCKNSIIGFTSIDEIKKMKHSKDLRKLIEEGDIVNGQKIKIHSESETLKIPKNIKTILTKEQHKANYYNVEEE